MPCGAFRVGQAGQSFTLQVTAGNSKVTGLLTDTNHSAQTVQPPQRFTDSVLKAGVTTQIAAGHTYHFLLEQKPAGNQVSVRFTDPNGVVTNCQQTGSPFGPWFIFA